MTKSRKSIGGDIDVITIAGTTGGGYRRQIRSANEVISKGLYAAFTASIWGTWTTFAG
jgi:hypothetical protein